ncbi:MAG: hypothetical protein KJ018_21530, partial [Burkholderiales bacterium]|nr:hypothetical protein [Burkholderiales bacterium]
PAYLRDVQRYWTQHSGRRVDTRWHTAFFNVTGVEDVRFVPHFVWWDELLGMFNDRTLRAAYGDKNLYRLLLHHESMPATVVKRMHGRYYDAGHRPLPRGAVVERIVADGVDRIVKPSRTDNGERVRRLAVASGEARLDGVPVALCDLEREYGDDFLVQAAIEQHPAMAAPHPASVNTLRVLTLRWEGEARALLAFARFGTDGRVTDNAGTGGICCGVDDDGRMHDAAVDKAGRLHARHPTTGYDFGARAAVPGFPAARHLALELHAQLPHFDLVSWDIAVDPRAAPIVVEANFRGSSFLYQFACRRPIFGELTPQVLAALRRRRGAAAPPAATPA